MIKILRILSFVFLFSFATETVLAEETEDVSLIQLIGNPEQFHEKKIRLIAFLHIEFEGNGLYLHREDHENALYRNGIWIDVTDPFYKAAMENNNQYVIAVGTFNARKRGHLGMWSGHIGQIERLDLWRTRTK